MYASQFNYDMAEPEADPIHDAQEHIAEQLDDGDQAIAKAFAEFAFERMGSDEIIDALAALFSVTDSKWRTLRSRLDDVVGGPLDCLRIAAEEHREAFVSEIAEQLLKEAA